MKSDQSGQTAIARLLLSYPELNMSAFARRMGIQQSLLAAYVSGSKKPSAERQRLIVEELHRVGRELLEASV